jgi:hypothetical protein
MVSDRDEELAAAARNVRARLSEQTGVELAAPEGLTAAELAGALARLDLALAQLADLASVYGDDSRGMLEPLIAPAAVVVGDYLRAALGAVWQEPDPAAPDELVILLPDQAPVDLLGLARLALAGGAPNLARLGAQFAERG